MPLYAELAGIKIGDGYPTRIMGVINVSLESFYKGSVRTRPDEIAQLAVEMVEEGADIIDIGAMSTAPYLRTEIPAEEEARRLVAAIRAVKEAVDIPISADTARIVPARAALEVGASIINDVSGLKHDERMAKLVAEYGASMIIKAYETRPGKGRPIDRIMVALRESLELARRVGVPEEKVVVDPGIGFFREEGRGIGFSPVTEYPWYIWDCMVIRDVGQLRDLGKPVCISVSRKSFIGKILNQERPEERLIGSLSATAIAVFNGVNLVRTHDVAATLQAVRIAESIRQLGKDSFYGASSRTAS